MSDVESHVLKSLAAMFNDQEHFDFVVKAGDQEFKVMKHVLSWHSEVFKSMFASGMREAQENLLKIDNFSPTTVEHLLRFCYSCKFTCLDKEVVMQVYEAADFYQMTHLTNLCVKSLSQGLTVNNVLQCLAWTFNHENADLKKTFMDFAVDHVGEIRERKDYKGFFPCKPIDHVRIVQPI